MPDDYSAAIGGGLKLKGSKPSGITKPKKKKKDKPAAESTNDDSNAATLQRALKDEESAANAEQTAQAGDGNGDGEGSSKTEAERNYDEMRRRRLDERLRKEGVKTHKQRVEALNKYLSTLSEHHDMPRIGPG